MIRYGTKSRKTQRLLALSLLALASALNACGSAAEPAQSSPVQTDTSSTATAAPSMGASAAGSAAAATTMATAKPSTGTQTTAAGAAPAAGAAQAGASLDSKPASAPTMMAAAAGSAAPAAGAAGAGAAPTGSEVPDGPATAAAGSGATGAAGAGTTSEMPREDLGKGDGSDVILIGDSWMNLGATGIQQSMRRLSMQDYRAYGVPGVRLLDEVIPGQYASAKRANPDIKTVVMTGGGNDILLTGAGADRSTAGPGTRGQIDMIADRLVMLWDEMGSEGVKDVVYIEYSRGGGSEAAVNYATEKIKPLCDGATATRCHWVDADDYLMMMLSADGIHPTGAGCDKIATGVIAMMEERGMRR